MFTGIIEEMGTIENIAKGAHSAVLTINARKILEDVHIGDSIAVNGVCLTVTSFDHERFTADVMHETLNRSALAQCKRKSPVNLERAMSANGRFGGHIVAGHVDATGQIAGRKKDDNAIWIRVEAPPEVLRYVVEKGSITIDGISLTVAAVSAHDFSVSMIPHTAEVTTLGSKKEGDIGEFRNGYHRKICGKTAASTGRKKGKPHHPGISGKLWILKHHGYNKRKNNRRNEQWKDLQPLRKHLRNYETEN